MLDCISVQNMRESDNYTIANFVSSLELMHRAAYGVYLSGQWQGSTAIVVGSGNNGGDGYALSCILAENGLNCTVFTVSQKLSADGADYCAKAEALNVPILPYTPGCLSGFDRIVDCLLGTGFQGILKEPYRSAVNEINGSGSYVISVDINSGMNGDTAEAELAVRSDLTVTIGYIKTGLVVENAGRYMKRLVCADIGIRLLKQEYKILLPGENNCGDIRHFACPRWLDPQVIRSF